MIKKHYQLFKKNRPKSLILIFVGSLIAAIFEMASIGSLPIFVGFISSPEIFIEKISIIDFKLWLKNLSTFQLILYSSSGVLVIFLIKNLFLAGLIFFENKAIYKIKYDLSKKVYEYYIFSDYELYFKTDSSTVSRNILSEVDRSINNLIYIIKFLREILVVTVIFILLLITDPIITISLSIIFSLAVGLFFMFVRKSLNSWANQNIILRKNLLQYVNEAFGSIKDIKIFQKEEKFTEKFSENILLSAKNSFFYQLVLNAPKIFLEVLSISLILVITFYFLLLDKNLNSFLPFLTLIVVSIIRLVPSFNTISQSISVYKSNCPSVEIVLDEITKSDAKKSEIIDTKKNTSLKNDENFNNLELKNVSYIYPSASCTSVEEISLSINKSQSIGITGKTGSGKTTLFLIMLGLLKPSTGSILFNNKDLKSNLKKWRSKIGYISQDIFLLDDSIKRNITFFEDRKEFDELKFQKVLEYSELKSFVDSLPNNSETKVGANGIKLSGGQKQRIGIARALYKDPEILFLDEATSALDNETEEKIIKNIKEFSSKTIIIITHRLSTITNCNKIFLIDEGKLKDHGKFEYLQTKYNLKNEKKISNH